MKTRPLALLFCAALVIGAPAWAARAPASGSAPMKLTVDLSNAARSIYRVHMTIPVSSGPLTLVYPKWIPGDHAPTGPVTNLSGLVIKANGKRLSWTRDPVKMYDFHVMVPAGVTRLDVKMNMVGMRNVDPNLADMAWNSVLLYPLGKPASDYSYQANLKLPSGWKYATSLKTTGHAGDAVHFAPVSLYRLVDSPVMALSLVHILL